ncbi:MAG TPA: hypothetical protein VFO27_15840, partial [Bryobacteraceae bacterium]|nr:hypothetical protein [Bryobacteraceae bacterium]
IIFRWMRQFCVLILGLVVLRPAGARPHYFHSAVLLEEKRDGDYEIYRIDDTRSIVTIKEKWRRPTPPKVLRGPVRISVENDRVYFLDQDGKEHKATVVERHPPPPPLPIP